MVLLYTALQDASSFFFLKYHFAQSLKWQHTVSSFGEVSVWRCSCKSRMEEVNFFSHCQVCELMYFIGTAIFF